MGQKALISGSFCCVSPLPIAHLHPHLQENGQTAVSTGSVQGLLAVVQGWGRGPAQDPRLVPLALEALVGTVHVLHASRTPSRGPELRALLEGYFRVLNADWPAAPSPGSEEALVTLRVSMLGGYGPRLLGRWYQEVKAQLMHRKAGSGCMGGRFEADQRCC